ncbi:MAG: hypothetical protein AAF171_23560 [Cyanobacteria bacterium P01_A01_bin.116]
MSQLSLPVFPNQPEDKKPIPAQDFPVLGIVFQGFLDPGINQVVFSQSGVARALQIDARTARRWLGTYRFQSLRGGSFLRSTLLTKVNNNPISVVTQPDLVALIRIGSERKNPVAMSMHDASFAVLLQQSVDQVLGAARPIKQYLRQGATLRQRAEYIHSYHGLKDAAFDNRHGVRGLSLLNRTVSTLAVPDSDARRRKNPRWRNGCSKDETMKLTIGNSVCEKAAKASVGRKALEGNVVRATNRINEINDILDQPF